MGSGQLAWMLGREAKKMGWGVRIIGGSFRDPAAAVADEHIQDEQLVNIATQTEALGGCDVVTFESEFLEFDQWRVPLNAAKYVFPNLDVMQLLADKWEQKTVFLKYKLPT